MLKIIVAGMALVGVAAASLLTLMSASSDAVEGVLLKYREPITSIIVDPHRSRIAVLRDMPVSAIGGDRGGITVYEIHDRRLKLVYERTNGRVQAASFAEDEDTLVFCEMDRLVRVDLDDGKELWTRDLHGEWIGNGLTVLSREQEPIIVVSIGTFDGGCELYQLSDGVYLGKRSHSGCQQVLPMGGDWISVGGEDVIKWTVSANDPTIAKQFNNRGFIRSIVVGDEMLCIGASDPPIEIWSTTTLERKVTIDLTPPGMWWFVAGNDDESVLVVQYEEIVKVSTENGKVLATTPCPTDISAVGNRLVDGCVIVVSREKNRSRLHMVSIEN